MMVNVSSNVAVCYFIFLPKSNVVKWSNTLEHTHSSDPNTNDWLLGYRDAVCIPIPTELAIALGWVTLREVCDEFNMPEHVRAALRLTGVL